MRRHQTFSPTSTTDPTQIRRGRGSATRPGRQLGGRSLAAGVLIAASFTVAACSKDEPTAVTILNTEKVERAIESSVATQRNKDARVSCPSGVHQKKGLVFKCTAVVKRQSTQFVVTQKDGAGRVHYEAR